MRPKRADLGDGGISYEAMIPLGHCRGSLWSRDGGLERRKVRREKVRGRTADHGVVRNVVDHSVVQRLGRNRIAAGGAGGLGAGIRVAVGARGRKVRGRTADHGVVRDYGAASG
jgi:hypothetical protein